MKKLYLTGILTLLTLLPLLSQAQCATVYDGFESGAIAPFWTTGTGTYTRTVVTGGAAQGNNYLQQTGGSSSHLNGLIASFPDQQPSAFSFYTRSANPSTASGYVVLGNNGMTSAGTCIIFCYFVQGNLCIYVNGNIVNIPAAANTWYFVEGRNINWTTKTYDLYVDGNLQVSGYPFRAQSINGLGAVHLYNFSSATAGWDDVTVGGNLLPNQTFTDVSCNGDGNGTAAVAPSGGSSTYTYTWSTGANTSSVSNLAPGTYTVTINDANAPGCSTTTSVTINEPPVLTAAVQSTNVSCPGTNNGTVDLTANGGTTGYSYLWSNGATTEDLNGVGSGTYIVTVTDANGCTATSGDSITAPPAFAYSSSISNVDCNGAATGSANATLIGGTPGYTYLWSNGATTPNITNVTAGGYSLQITDANGCTFDDSLTITEPTAIATSVTSVDVTCPGGSTGSTDLTVSGGTAGYTYLWSDGSTTEDLTNVPAGGYSVVVTDANGCTTFDSLNITQPAAFNAGFNAANVNCPGGSDGSIDFSLSGATPGYTFLWSDGSTTEDVSNLTAGTYSVVATDANGCTFTDSVSISAPVAFTYADSIFDNLCAGDANGMISLSVSGGTPGYTYNWSNGDTSPNPSNLAAGTYSLILTDANNCTDSIAYTITEPAPLASSGVVTDDVGGTQSGSIDYSISGGTAGYTFVWSNGETTEDISNLGGGTYIVTATDANGCSVMDTFTVEIVIGVDDAVNPEVLVYPNPTTDDINLLVEGLSVESMTVRLIDLNGRILTEEMVAYPGNTVRRTLELSDYTAGIYFLQVQSGDWSKMVKVLRK